MTQFSNPCASNLKQVNLPIGSYVFFFYPLRHKYVTKLRPCTTYIYPFRDKKNFAFPYIVAILTEKKKKLSMPIFLNTCASNLKHVNLPDVKNLFFYWRFDWFWVASARGETLWNFALIFVLNLTSNDITGGNRWSGVCQETPILQWAEDCWSGGPVVMD